MLPVPDWMVYATAIFAWAAYIYLVVRDSRSQSKNKKEKDQ